MRHYLGIEIGGTKLQLGLGAGDGSTLSELWRATVDPQQGAERIRQQIIGGVAELLSQTNVAREQIAGVGIGFGGPVDSTNGITVTSHQVPGWDNFPIVEWVGKELAFVATLHNDADTAALAEATFGAGRGFDPVLYVTVGSGIGGGLICAGKIFRGSGVGAVEIGHLRPGKPPRHGATDNMTVEAIASGFGIQQRWRSVFTQHQPLEGGHPTTQQIARAASDGDTLCRELIADATETLGWALGQAITLINPARIVIGGGVSLIGEELFFEPVRRACRAAAFPPFANIAEIVPAALGEEVVVHGALVLARGAIK